MHLSTEKLKWYKKLVFHLFTLSMVQAHCLHNKHKKSTNSKTLQFTDFVLKVCCALVEKGNVELAATVAPPETHRLKGRHFPTQILTAAGNPGRRACHVCLERMKRAGSSSKDRKNKRKTAVQECNVCKVALCKDCFEDYHTKKDYL